MCTIRGEWLKDYTYYNDRVNSATVERLLELNRQFYLQRGRDFAETRLRIQPGIKRIIELTNQVSALQSRLSEVNAELDRARRNAKPSTALVLWQPRRGPR